MIDKLVWSLLTPDHVLQREHFSEPQIITPARFHNFSALVLRREDIRHLRLLPAKSPAAYTAYHAVPDLAKIAELQAELQRVPQVLLPNKYPYDLLPPDVRQEVLWYDDQAPNSTRARFVELIVEMLQRRRLGIDDLIIFQRGELTKVKMVKRSFPHVHHLHVWTRRRGPDA